MNAPQTPGQDELQPMSSETRIAVMSVQIGHISETLARIEANSGSTVPRSEWEQRNVYVDGRFVDVFAQLTSIRTEAAGRRAPWWTIVAAGAGGLAVVAYLFDIIPTIVN